MVEKHKGGESFVVLHTLVDEWPQGSLIKADDPKFAFKRKQRGPDGTEEEHEVNKKDRLLQLGAIRPATEEEVKLGKGFATGTTGLPIAAQMQLAALQAEVEQQRRLAGDLQEKMATLERLASVPVAPVAQVAAAAAEDPALVALLEQHQAELDALKKTNEETAKKVDELHAKAQQPAEAPKTPRAPAHAPAPHAPPAAVKKG